MPTISLYHSTDTSAAQDRYIRVLHMRNQTVRARETTSNAPGLRRISAQTVRNRLRENGLRARRPYFVAVLRRRHRLARVRWWNRVRDWDLQIWGWVWFSDESRFMLQKRYGCTQTPEWEVRKELRPWDQQFRRRKCDDVGCHIIRRKTQLVHIHGNLNAARHIDEVLKPHTLPAMDLRREVFQHDNARSHTLVLLLTF